MNVPTYKVLLAIGNCGINFNFTAHQSTSGRLSFSPSAVDESPLYLFALRWLKPFKMKATVLFYVLPGHQCLCGAVMVLEMRMRRQSKGAVLVNPTSLSVVLDQSQSSSLD
ncbi:uncharacterized protein V6R79_018888 [Siganus canaliculatus]